MSREIKFRAWDKKSEDYVDVFVIDFENRSAICEHSEFGISTPIDLDNLILEQFTGVKDKTGKDIYEGDILEYYYVTHEQTFYDPDTLGAVGSEPGIETTVIGKVAIWPSTGVVLTRIKAEYPEDFDSSNLDVPKMLHVNKHFTIIGNVHTNPELLEAQHD